MNFIKTATSTLYNPEFYESLKEKTIGRSLFFLAKIALVFAIFGGVLSASVISPLVTNVLSDLQTEVLATYPAGLEITIEKGIATSNAKTEPLFFPVKESWKKISLQNAGSKVSSVPDYFFVLYTGADEGLTADSFRNMKTYSLLTSKHFAAYDAANGVVIKDLSGFGDTKINKDTILRLFTLARFIPIVIPFIYFVSIFFAIFFLSVLLVLIALSFFLIHISITRSISFSNSYKICLHAATIPILMSFLFTLAGIPQNIILSLLLLMTLVIAMINTKNMSSSKPEQVGSAN